MFETIDPDRSLSKEEYDREIPRLRERIGVLQREFRDKKIPVLIVFEGWRVSGISSTINQLTYALDPRGYRVHVTSRPDDTARMHPLLWRFWVRTPARGHIAIFDRSWYTDTFLDMRGRDRKTTLPTQAIDDIVSMEHLLAVDGTVIIKIFLHISKKEQKKRLKKLREDRPDFILAVDRERKGLPDYDTVSLTLEHLISTTDTPGAPWTIVEANDRHFTVVKVFDTIIRRLEETLRAAITKYNPLMQNNKITRTLILPSVDLTRAPEDDTSSLNPVRRLHELQYSIHSKKIPRLFT
jgi:polyphosphate kinase 2 (PPK2 family)